jgi:hypothetical protein
MSRYSNKRMMLRTGGGQFRKAVPADVGIGGVCPVCRHFLLQHYDGDDTQHPDPRLFRYRCFTCEPLTEAEQKTRQEKLAQEPKFSMADFFSTATPPNKACSGLAGTEAAEGEGSQPANR